MTNFDVNGELLMYFLIGLVVVWLYAWNRFNRRSYEPAPFDYKVLRELQPAQMRDSLLMQRAFLLYALVLSLLYATFTFFSGVILRIAKYVPSIGPIDLDAQALQSPQWPLIIAFGLAGLTQLIGPLDHLEKTLRGHIHRSLGIPIRIKEYTRLLVAHQLRELNAEAAELAVPTDAAPKDSGPVEKNFRNLSGHVTGLKPWARNEIAQTYQVEDVLGKLVVLWRMIDSLYSPQWPRESVRDEMRPLMSRQLAEARAAARYLSELLDTPMAGKAETAASGDDGGGYESTQFRTRQEQQLVIAIESMERHLYEIGAINAVYAQRDREYKNMSNGSLKEAVTAVFKAEDYGPSLRQLACCAAVLFIGYIAAISFLDHGLMASMPRNFWTKGVSAAYETLRTMCIYVFPVLFAIYATSPNPEQPRPRTAMGVAMSAALWAGFANLILMALLAMLYTWLVARDSDHFNQLLLGRLNTDASFPPFLWWFMSAAPFSAFVAACVVMARRVRPNAGHGLTMGLVAVLAAVLAALHGSLFGSGFPACFDPDQTITVVSDPPACWKNVVDGVANNLIDAVAALVSILFLMQTTGSGRVAAEKPDEKPKKKSDEKSSDLSGPPAGSETATIILTAILMLALMSWTQAQAQEQDHSRRVVLGMREDAAPFAYRDPPSTGRHQGYLADLCYEIFAGSQDYDVVTKTITIRDRFERLRPGKVGASPDDLVDIVCDPVTVRYDDPQRTQNAIFSPIVFATGVTYLKRKNARTDLDIEIAYVDGTTAKTVVLDICRDVSARTAEECRDGGSTPSDASPDPLEATEPPDGKNWFLRLGNRISARLRNADDRDRTFTYYGMKSHEQLARWFCRDNPRVQKFYIGDRDVIWTKWNRARARSGGCDAEATSQLFTYEPYALMITKDRPDLVQFVQRRIYEIFSDASKARAIFSATFPASQMSTSLAYLFLLNGVDEDYMPRYPDGSPVPLRP
ncbi:transporter substrate-binding domain-containing protein [Paracoccus sp. YIM 132242]|uniref:Transporter substrate-binding domain-containing protein n=1 Tax=Paracoccus lichenicola TaxID=2665644 RepID=A0A6L6HMZ3_9RHOB|nr:transporter substrate-binding domain-containing protein [Paracoccus lichenicola]MTD99619.1 transporter substrate-binding domain-containing protein [Paracoccus lichenicola]